jgi:hypothetical protein
MYFNALSGKIGDSKRNEEVNGKKMPDDVNTFKYKSNLLACVSITPDGKMKKQFIEEPKDYDFQLMPERSLNGEVNILYFMAVKSSVAFTASHVLNHADYHFGTIVVKN